MTPISLASVPAESLPSTARGIAPTDEQAAAIDVFTAGDALVLEALAGTGKTTTLKLMSAAVQQSRPFSRGVYVAYNKAIADDAKASFPKNTRCGTAHSFAYAEVGRLYRDRLKGSRLPAFKVAEILGCEAVDVGPGRSMRRSAVARTALDTVRNFCNSADREPGEGHVPYVEGLDPAFVRAFRTQVVVYARRAWTDLQNPKPWNPSVPRAGGGRLKFDHDVYLKLWQLSNPRIPGDFILFDEAQDANAVIASVVLAQDAQLVAVGDQNQAIYAWRGAVDAMRDWPAEHRLPLAQSFRFGPAIADEANVWLDKLGCDLRVRGFDRVDSRVERLSDPRAILCRTNAQAVAEALSAIECGVRVAIVGGVQQIRSMARAASDLKAGTGTDHPDLCAFQDWAEVQEYVEDDQSAADLRVLVQLVDRYGVGAIFRVTDAVVDERDAQLIVSTAHKSKGREFESVLIAPDFRPPKDGEDIERGEAQLLYVSTTRAKRVLDNSSVEWARDYRVAR